MANFVKCRFVLIGNKSIDNLVEEMMKRIHEDRKINVEYADTSRVGRLFYGLEGNEALLSDEVVGAKWIHDDQDYDDSLKDYYDAYCHFATSVFLCRKFIFFDASCCPL